jgi:hypothetical protein
VSVRIAGGNEKFFNSKHENTATCIFIEHREMFHLNISTGFMVFIDVQMRLLTLKLPTEAFEQWKI